MWMAEQGDDIYTVFPNDQTRLPQDFPTYAEAKQYGDENEPGGYTIEKAL